MFRLVPVSVTSDPTVPLVGLNPVIIPLVRTVNDSPLMNVPSPVVTVTLTMPVAVCGTVTTTCRGLADTTVATIVPNFTVGFVAVGVDCFRAVPLIETVEPLVPLKGVMPPVGSILGNALNDVAEVLLPAGPITVIVPLAASSGTVTFTST